MDILYGEQKRKWENILNAKMEDSCNCSIIVVDISSVHSSIYFNKQPIKYVNIEKLQAITLEH